MQEAQAASSLDHPNICTIHEIDETPDGQMFLAMTFYDGETVVPAAGGEPRLLVQLDDPSHGSVRSEFAASAERFYFHGHRIRERHLFD